VHSKLQGGDVINEHAGLAVEQHSIDFIPLSQRYGTPLRLFTIWFSINLSIVCLTVGTLGVAAGLSFGWAALALALGNGIGTVFMAAHSAQGPHLGIPQMIQSRAQFGVFGAALPLVAVIATYTLYTAANAVIVREPLGALMPFGDDTTLMIFGVITLVIAYIGYELIHRMGALLAIMSAALFATAMILLWRRHDATPMPITTASASFQTAAFLLTVTQSAAWSLSFGPYVADYSRYLPDTVSTWSTFWHTAIGNFLGATALMVMGAYLATYDPRISADPGTGLANLFGRGSYIVKLMIVVGVLEGSVMNLYSAYMSTTTILTGARSMNRVGAGLKFLIMLILIAAATWIAIATREHFDLYFGDMLSALIYVLIPWSAINLADYYIVRRGHYVIADMFDVNGIYGRYRWTGIITYLLGILIQLPFMSLSFYTGAAARALGADVAWVPGLIVPAILYCLLEKARQFEKQRPAAAQP
jgi:NCS1 family nucleobase:cation symporter-1